MRKQCALAGQVIQIGSFDLFISVATQHIKGLLIGKNKNQIWFFDLLCRRSKQQHSDKGQCNKNSFHSSGLLVWRFDNSNVYSFKSFEVAKAITLP